MDGGQAKPGYICKQHVDAKEVHFMICHKKSYDQQNDFWISSQILIEFK